jgi:uncharacterized membrane protein
MRFMKVLLNFLMTTVIGGLLVLLPVALFVFILGDVLAMVAALAAPIAELLPVEELGGASVATLVALALIIGFCFLVGLVARTAIGSRLGGWVEGAVLRRVPVYGMLKTLSQQFIGTDTAEKSMFLPAVLSLPQDSLQLVYVIEEHGNGFSTVMIPSVPAALAGPLQYVRSERLRKLEVPLARVVQSLQGCGIGAGPLFAPDTSAPSAAS